MAYCHGGITYGESFSAVPKYPSVEHVVSERGMNDWCDQQDWVPDGDRIYRCTKCGKRLCPRERQEDGKFLGWQLPPHKTKAHKIKAIKARQHRIRKVR